MRANFTIPHSRPRGAAMIIVLMFILVCTIVFTAWLHLLAARNRQVEGMMDSAQRHIAWNNMEGIQQEYAYSWAMRDRMTTAAPDNMGSTRASSAATPVSAWGGITAGAWNSLKAFRSTNRAAGGTSAYPFNNIDPIDTTNRDVYFERISAASDSTQVQSVNMFGYLKTYPTTLLGDLFIVHKRYPGAASYYLSDNIQVNGRVVVWDETAEVGNLRALSCLNMTATGVLSTDNTSASATIMPLNLPKAPRVTNGGYGPTLSSAGSATSVTNGTLNLVNNANFAPGSIRAKMAETGYNGWVTISTNAAVNASSPSTVQNINTTGSSTVGTSTSDIQILQESSYTYGLAPSPHNQSTGDYPSPSSRLTVCIIRLKNSTLKHVCIQSGVEQLVIEGSTALAGTTGYTSNDGYTPVIISVEETNLRDIRFIGENNRRFILAVKGAATATPPTYYCQFYSPNVSGVGTTMLDWRMNWINENRLPYIDIRTSGLLLNIIGSVRTDREINFMPSGSDARVFINQEESPGTLETLLPRDGWVEPYFIAQ